MAPTAPAVDTAVRLEQQLARARDLVLRAEARAEKGPKDRPGDAARYIGIADVQGIFNAAGFATHEPSAPKGLVSVRRVKEVIAKLEAKPGLLKPRVVQDAAAAPASPRDTIVAQLEAQGTAYPEDGSLVDLAHLLEYGVLPDAAAANFDPNDDADAPDDDDSADTEPLPNPHNMSGDALRAELKHRGKDVSSSIEHKDLIGLVKEAREQDADNNDDSADA